MSSARSIKRQVGDLIVTALKYRALSRPANPTASTRPSSPPVVTNIARPRPDVLTLTVLEDGGARQFTISITGGES